SKPEEKKAAKADTSQKNSTEYAQSHGGYVDASSDKTRHASARNDPRDQHELGGQGLEQSVGTAHESNVEGPPAKATPVRHSGLRARSNLLVDRPVGTARDQQLPNAGPPDGPGDV
ncbi:hypothetical protein MRX96_041629, partial [Rhipicephalus microplus]